MSTIPELCAGIVKAGGVFPKNPGQYLADINMLEGTAEVAPAFLNPFHRTAETN